MTREAPYCFSSQIEAAGQQELLNWMCLAGAMQELDRKPEIVDYVETRLQL